MFISQSIAPSFVLMYLRHIQRTELMPNLPAVRGDIGRFEKIVNVHSLFSVFIAPLLI
jgi:hypothetical protein